MLLLVSETTGALSPTAIWLLRQLARVATLPTGNDTTVYGTSRTSPSSFFLHHIAAISSAIAAAQSHTPSSRRPPRATSSSRAAARRCRGGRATDAEH